MVMDLFLFKTCENAFALSVEILFSDKSSEFKVVFFIKLDVKYLKPFSFIPILPIEIVLI